MSTCHRRSNSSQSSTNKPNILTSPLSHKKTSSSIQFIQKALNPLSIPSHRLPFKKPPKVVLLFLLLVALLTFLLTNSTPTQTKKYTKPTSTPNVTDISTLHLFPPSVIAEYLPYYFNNSLYHEYIDENNNTQGIPTVISTSIGYSLSTFHLKKTWPEVRYFNQALLMVMSQQNGTYFSNTYQDEPTYTATLYAIRLFEQSTNAQYIHKINAIITNISRSLQKSILPDGSIVPLNNESVCSSTVSAVEIMRELLLPVPSKTNAFIEKCSSGCIQNKCAATCTQCTLLTYLKYVSGYISYEYIFVDIIVITTLLLFPSFTLEEWIKQFLNCVVLVICSCSEYRFYLSLVYLISYMIYCRNTFLDLLFNNNYGSLYLLVVVPIIVAIIFQKVFTLSFYNFYHLDFVWGAYLISLIYLGWKHRDWHIVEVSRLSFLIVYIFVILQIFYSNIGVYYSNNELTTHYKFFTEVVFIGYMSGMISQILEQLRSY